jgi:hypothetical protein
MAVGIIIVHLIKFGGDMETVNRYILTNIGNINLGNTIGGHNGKKHRRI